MKLSSFHIVASSFAAIAGVAIAGYQAFAPKMETPAPVQVTVAVEPAQPAGDAAVKQDGGPMLQTSAVALERNASFSAALKDGSDTRYSFASLFDGKPDTHVTVTPEDAELNVLVTFNTTSAQRLTAIQYTPPPGVEANSAAASLDVVVLPEGEMGGSGHQVINFTLQRTGEMQTFAIPGNATGKALWLRVAGAATGQPLTVGDFSLLREQLTP